MIMAGDNYVRQELADIKAQLAGKTLTLLVRTCLASPLCQAVVRHPPLSNH
jgi:hypothetical protein